MLRYVFDLDNTLCVTKKNNDGVWDYENSEPLIDRIQIVNELYEQGNYIIIDTARGSTSKKDWYNFTMNQLKEFGVKFNELRSGIKFSGDYYIDDKGINSEDFFKQKLQDNLD
jgi:FMN phosphatase YigB (HAD superfamily)